MWVLQKTQYIFLLNNDNLKVHNKCWTCSADYFLDKAFIKGKYANPKKNFKQKIYHSKQWATVVQSVSGSILLFDSQAE